VTTEDDTAAVPAITVAELDGKLRGGANLDLVDVREPHEWDIGRIEGARLAPLSTFADALRTFDSARDVIVYCKSGVRSAKAVRQLQEAGFRRVWNLEGGILRWSEQIDPTVPRY
jgi:adenylyltransferase/sulfurtransferase